MSDQPALSPDVLAEVRGLAAHIREARTDSAIFRTEAALDRLGWLLGLSDVERSFVRAACDAPSDFITLEVFADWLEEQGRPEAERFRRLTPQTGDVLVWEYGDGNAREREAVENAAAIISNHLAAMGRKAATVVVPVSPTGHSCGPTLLHVKDGDVLVWEFDLGNEQMYAETLTTAEIVREKLLGIGKQTVFATVPRGSAPEVRTDTSHAIADILALISDDDRSTALEYLTRMGVSVSTDEIRQATGHLPPLEDDQCLT